MKNCYKIDSTFYFLLLLIYKDQIEKHNIKIEDEIIKAKIKLNKKYNINKNVVLNNKRITNLISCVGSVIFKKQKKYYFAKITELLELLSTYNIITDSVNINFIYLKNLIKNNLQTNNHNTEEQNIFNYLIENNYFQEIKVHSEYKKLFFFISKHKLEGEKSND